MHTPIVIDSLEATRDRGYEITAHCEVCRHSAHFDLDDLIERLGAGHGALHKDLAPRLKCSRCGSRDIGIRLGRAFFGRSVAATWGTVAG